jgi:hypothetical protein
MIAGLLRALLTIAPLLGALILADEYEQRRHTMPTDTELTTKIAQLCARLNLRPDEVIALAVRNLHRDTTPDPHHRADTHPANNPGKHTNHTN